VVATGFCQTLLRLLELLRGFLLSADSIVAGKACALCEELVPLYFCLEGNFALAQLL
jgi:hypothetical protein